MAAKVNRAKLITILVLVALVAIVVAQNTHAVEVTLLFATLRMPLILMFLTLFFIGFVVGAVLFYKRGRRHQARRTEKAAAAAKAAEV